MSEQLPQAAVPDASSKFNVPTGAGFVQWFAALRASIAVIGAEVEGRARVNTDRAIDAAPIAKVITSNATGDVAGGIVDESNRATWLTHDPSGGPTDYARGRMGMPVIESEDAAGGFIDAASRLTWLTHTRSGGPTPYAVAWMRQVLGLGDTPTNPTSPTAPAVVTAPSNRHAMLENELRLNNGGTIRTGGAAPVCIIFDHGTYLFKRVVLPLLRARGLPSTLALNSRMLAPGAANAYENRETTFAEIDSWTVADKVEVANHGATHRSGPFTEADAADDIVAGLKELQAALPSRRILSWVQPAIEYPGFNNGTSTANWVDTEAGKLIYQHHATSTGLMKAPGHPNVPRDGTVLQGVSGVWIDGAGFMATIKPQIEAAIAAKQGIILRCHPKSVDQGPALFTTAEITELLDYLKAQQDAGRLRVMTFAQWSIADTGI